MNRKAFLQQSSLALGGLLLSQSSFGKQQDDVLARHLLACRHASNPGLALAKRSRQAPDCKKEPLRRAPDATVPGQTTQRMRSGSR